MNNSIIWSLPGVKADFGYARKVIAEAWGHDPGEITSKCRRQDILFPRQLAMYVGCKHFRMSQSTVGFMLGGFDHSTVFNSCKQVRNMWETDKFFRAKVSGLLPIIGINAERFI